MNERRSDAPVRLTEAALEHVRKVLGTQAKARGLRLSVRNSGCSGWMYHVEPAAEPRPDDLVVDAAPDVQVFIDRASLPLVAGTEIDFVREGLNRSLRFKNPNAVAECGCGESFAVDRA